MAQYSLVPEAQAVPIPSPKRSAVEILQQCPAHAAFRFFCVAERLDCITAMSQTTQNRFTIHSDAVPDDVVSCLPTIHDREEATHIMNVYEWKAKLKEHCLSNTVGTIFAHPNPSNILGAEARNFLAVLIAHLYEALYRAISTTLSFRVPEIGEIVMPTNWIPATTGVHNDTSGSNICMMPCGTDMPLWCLGLEDCIEVHLVTGLLIYFVWPPSEQNLSLVRTYLDDVNLPNYMNVCEQFEGGMTIVQRQPQIVHLPPYCLRVAFATENSTTITYRYRTNDNIRLRLLYAPLLSRQVLSVDNPFYRPATLDGQIERLVKELCSLLLHFASDIGNSRYMRLVESLKADWHRIKGPFQETVEKHTSMKLKADMFTNVAERWYEVTLWYNRNSGLPVCFLCSELEHSDRAMYREHFAKHHWYPPSSGGSHQ